jgi:signal transduction histidine kinase
MPVFLAIILFPHFANAQNNKIDSLKTVLQTAKDDTNKINILNALASNLIDKGGFDSAMTYASAAKDLAEKTQFKKGIASSYNNTGNVYLKQGDYTKALKNYLQALKVWEEFGPKKNIAIVYGNIGIIYTYEKNYAEAIKSELFALQLYQQIGKSERAIAICYNNIANIYFTQHNYAEALTNSERALKIREQIGDKASIANSYNYIGAITGSQGNHAAALKSFLASLKIYEEIGNKLGIASEYNNIGNVFINQRNYNEARKNYLAALQVDKEIGDKKGLSEAYSGLAELSDSIGDYKNAYMYHMLFSAFKDSLLNESSNKQIIEMMTKYETEKKDKEIAILNSENKIKDAEVKKQIIIKYSEFLLATSILGMAFIGFRNIRIKNKAAQLAKANEIRQKISRDLHDEIGSGLTSISMICVQSEAKMECKENVAMLEMSDAVKTQSRQVTEKLRELVWATNPENDTLEAMLFYMRNYVPKYLDKASIDYSLNLPDDAPPIKLENDISRNLIFVLKEALNNSVKYSGASKVEVLLSINENKKFNFKIEDNGKGIDYNSMPVHHSGLGNMRKRIEEIKGKFEIVSEKGSGTRIEISGTFA